MHAPLDRPFLAGTLGLCLPSVASINACLARCLVPVLLVLVGGCSGKSADFCRLLTMDEVRKLHPEVVTAKMEEWYKSTDHPTWFCSWKDGSGRNLLSLSVSFTTSNSSKDLLTTYSGGSRVAEVPGVGNDAAVLFYRDKEDSTDRFTLFARNDKWILDIRSPIVGDEDGEQFQIVKELANRTFASLDTDKVFSKLKK